jgi:hypothetical protein
MPPHIRKYFEDTVDAGSDLVGQITSSSESAAGAALSEVQSALGEAIEITREQLEALEPEQLQALRHLVASLDELARRSVELVEKHDAVLGLHGKPFAERCRPDTIRSVRAFAELALRTTVLLGRVLGQMLDILPDDDALVAEIRGRFGKWLPAERR